MNKITRFAVVTFVCLLAGAAIFTGKDNEPDDSMAVPADTTLPRFLDLGSHYCTPCQMMAPELDALSEEYAGVVNVEFIDVNEDPLAAETYGVRLIPTQIIFDADGNELFRHEGFMNREEMAAKLIEFGYNSPHSRN